MSKNNHIMLNCSHSAYISRIHGDIENTLLKGLEFNRWKECIKKDSVVFVKPNFTYQNYKEGVTTNPQLLKKLLEILRNRSSNIVVGESDGGDNSFRAEVAFSGHGMYKICEEVGVKLVNLSRLPSIDVESIIQGKRVRVQLPKMLVEDVDCFVSVPVLKVHVVTEVSLGMKNMWGCIPDTMRGLHHKNLDRKLVLIAKVLNPKIVIIDGIYGLNGHGPMFGEPTKTDLLIVSNNVVVSDTLGTMVMGLKLKRAKHVGLAEKEGLGTTNLNCVRINTKWEQFGMSFHINKTLLDRASIALFYSDSLAKLVMSSPFSPVIYKVASLLRTPEERVLAQKHSL